MRLESDVLWSKTLFWCFMVGVGSTISMVSVMILGYYNHRYIDQMKKEAGYALRNDP